MAIVLTLGGEVMRIIYVYGSQNGRPDAEKVRFCDEMESEWDMESSSEIIVSLGDFNGHEGKCAEGFERVHGGNGIGKRNAEGKDCRSFVMKKSCAWQTLGLIRQTKAKSLIVPVNVKQKLILCLLEKIQKVCKGCESDFMGTSAQARGRRSGQKGFKKHCEKATDHKKKDLEVE